MKFFTSNTADKILFKVFFTIILVAFTCFAAQDYDLKSSLKFLDDRNSIPGNSLSHLALTAANQGIENEPKCIHSGGKVYEMVAKYDTHDGWIEGISKKFCQISLTSRPLSLFGIEIFSSKKPNFAATYLKSMVIDPSKQIPGPYGRQNMNLCHQLRGAMITFVANGGYDQDGLNDLCFFGDGSSVSAWTLYYFSVGKFND